MQFILPLRRCSCSLGLLLGSGPCRATFGMLPVFNGFSSYPCHSRPYRGSVSGDRATERGGGCASGGILPPRRSCPQSGIAMKPPVAPLGLSIGTLHGIRQVGMPQQVEAPSPYPEARNHHWLLVEMAERGITAWPMSQGGQAAHAPLDSSVECLRQRGGSASLRGETST